ncbi:MAG TPA: hypothetical protein PKC30_09510 [Saprospiraceae bacterium]|nr:hypothetical protein [Saprospiraceae bacterium]
MEKVTEGDNTGWSLLGRNPVNYGNIGNQVIDLSESIASGNYLGAVGNNSFSAGRNTLAEGDFSVALGRLGYASGFGAMAISGGEASCHYAFSM